jgi:hypothetical protein
MKSSEFIRVDEGLGDLAKSAMSWAGNKALQAGLGGKTRQIAAVGAQMQREKTALGQALGQQNNKNFLEKLPKDIIAAINGGQINTGSSGAGRTMEQFVLEYVKTLFQNFSFDATTGAAIEAKTKEFAQSFQANLPNSRNPVLTGDSLKKAQAIWDAAKAGSAITSTGYSNSGGGGVAKPPAAGEEVITARGKYSFDGTEWSMTEKVTSPPGSTSPTFATIAVPIKITDPVKIRELNRLAAAT